MSRYAKKPVNKYGQPCEANRRVQTEAADIDDIDLQQAILKFKNLQEKQKTPLKNQRTKSKSPAPQLTTVDYSQYTFTSLKVIGQGSFGIVYKAKVNETGEIVAVKKVIQDKRYKNREIQILQELDHPNVVETKHAYFTYGDSPDEQYLNVIMDYQPETLHSFNAQFLKQQQLLPEIQAKLYSYQLLRSIAYVHTKGICHRDIKPHNVLINPDTNILKLCDFGSAKRLTPSEPNIAYICSRCYRAPELLFGATNYTTQVDMWSVGCIIGEMFNGLPLFLGASAVDQLVEIIKILGSPSREEVLSMNESYDIKSYKIVPIRKKEWKKVFQTVIDPLAIDLISKILTYCPRTRLNALQGLAHSYFDDLRDETTLKMYQSKIQIPDLFDFTKEELQNNQLLANKLIPKWSCFLLLLALGVSSLTVDVKDKCACSEIKNIADCNVDCFWNRVAGTCINSPIQLIRKGYCAGQANCNKTWGCGNYYGICVPFSGCTAITYNTHQGCQEYSNRCITDGVKCVELGTCSSYTSRYSCKNDYELGVWKGYCFWAKDTCRSPKLCGELPASLKNDEECRAQMSNCTSRERGGCVESGEQCKYQKQQDQCITNKAGTVKCFWDGQTCNDYSCKFILTDCIKNGCSIGVDLKCMDRSSCDGYANQTSCTYDTQNKQCMWEDGKCMVKSCSNASTTRLSNELCTVIYPTCITKFGGGCRDNGECEDADNKIGCKQNIRGETCYWNGYQCVLKQCQWAPLSYQSANSCKNFISNCVYNGKKCVDNGCYALTTQGDCGKKNSCRWQKNCDVKSCYTAGKDIYHISHDDCNSYLSECTVSDSGIGCMNIRYSCESYGERQCYLSTTGECSWQNNACVARKCEYGIYNTHDVCWSFLEGCTSDGTKCMSVAGGCSTYTKQTSCVVDAQNNACIWVNNKCTQMTCQQIPKNANYNTHQECNNYMNFCTVIDRVQGCQDLPASCDLYSIDQCQTSKCIYSNGVCRDKKCSDYKGEVTQSICEAYLANKLCMRGPGLYPTSCQDKPVNCSGISNEFQCLTDKTSHLCTWQSLLCKEKTCGNIITDAAVTTTAQICETWMPTCTLDLGTPTKCTVKTVGIDTCTYYLTQKYCSQQSKCYWNSLNTCTDLKITCDQYIQADCSTTILWDGNECSWKDNQCVPRCSTIAPTLSSCEVLSSKCVWATSNTCTTKSALCSAYNGVVDQCNDDSKCVWKAPNCIERSCSDVTDAASTNNSCSLYKSTCTVSYSGGCVPLQASCSGYLSQIQCHLNSKNKQCYWNKSNVCVDLKCENADVVFPTDKCLTFFAASFNLSCAINNTSNGCIPLTKSCDLYLNENQCIKLADESSCQWRDSKCQFGTCQAVVLTTYNHINCLSALNQSICTVNTTLDGCIDQIKDCNLYATQEQCHITTTNIECIWNSIYNHCQPKSCFDDVDSATSCSTYLSTCTETSYPCRDLVCEDFIYDTDSQCTQANKQCTSNGLHCITRGTCEQNNYEAACIRDINGKLCGWNSTFQKCGYITCDLAPLTVKYDQDCKVLFPKENCVAKNGGGCNVIKTCTDYSIEQSCNNNSCIWDKDICRVKQCHDFYGLTYQECNNKVTGCTTNGLQCIPLAKCSTLSQSLCVVGSDGPCLYLNSLCYQYSGCSSIPFTDHQSCYTNLQQQCTTNGTTCVPVTECAEYKLEVSCVVGIDGQCAWNKTKCELFTSCEQYKFKTHNECNSINTKCTTDTLTVCQDLQSCSDYHSQENCKLNKIGKILTNGLVTSLGTCLWDGSTCTDSTCSSINGNTHAACNNQLSTCTSDGLKCISMMLCSQYSGSQCSLAMGIDGKCQYNDSQCALFDCTILTTSTQCVSYSHCQYINSQCQFIKKCSEYADAKYCTTGSDGQCVMANSKCQLMTSCSQASEYKYCTKQYCDWNSTSVACQPHSCTTYSHLFSCTSFYNYNSAILTYCGQQNSTCTEVSPDSFTEAACYSLSKGFYNFANGVCTSCKYIPAPIPNPVNSTNNTQNSTDTNVSDSRFISIALILILILI